jgi:hypothetical protein
MRSDLPIIVSLFLGFGMAFAQASSPTRDIPVFEFEQQAKQHCPADSVVWVIRTQGIYNASVERFYGRTTNGAYACLMDVEKAGFLRASTAGH